MDPTPEPVVRHGQRNHALPSPAALQLSCSGRGRSTVPNLTAYSWVGSRAWPVIVPPGTPDALTLN